MLSAVSSISPPFVALDELISIEVSASVGSITIEPPDGESSMMLDRFNIRCLVTPETVVPVSKKAFEEWSYNSNYTTQSFDLNNATVLVRVKNINLSDNVENHT